MIATRTILLGLALTAGLAGPAAAQRRSPQTILIRPFVMGTEQSFAAVDTFDATFGRTYDPFFGGGVEVVLFDRYYIELGASRFRQTGQRAFRNAGQVFHLAIPLTATITPLEISGGYRFHLSPRVVPYVGAGFGSYAYTETSSFADTGENVDTHHAGYSVTGGSEFRVHRWVSIGADVHYTHVPGLLGMGGISLDAGETDLGGVAGRFKVIVGK